ncbi:hypothetical protein ZEAMMB73_Zm00001d037491 [Zea mays]|jgi:hypothetical protein|uniref:Uncharacterized protein n=1 Tax=Zea mays TaxID=4577 RepID=A0A1D6LY81_MAIZE|nr:hypothetical protein ZEAMMB73_Zm00001d037491 [Zea mays]
MCRATAIEGGFLRPPPSRRLDVRAFYLRLSSCSATTPAELTLAYHPAIGGAAQGLNGRALPPAAPAKVTLRRVAAAEGARFKVLVAAGEEVAAEGVFSAQREGVWHVECRGALASPKVCVAEVVVLAEGGVLMQDRARAAEPPGWRGYRRRTPPRASASGSAASATTTGGKWSGTRRRRSRRSRWRRCGGRWRWAVCLGVGLFATAACFLYVGVGPLGHHAR